MIIKEMESSDHTAAYALWSDTPGVGVTPADSLEGIERFLKHNPGLCFVCEDQGTIIGTALCGSDGRRGYLYHVAVLPQYHKQGIGRGLVQRCMDALREQRIDRCHVFVFADNEVGNAFWAAGWQKRNDLFVYSHQL